MWETPFDESMLCSRVIIHCPEKSDVNELFRILAGCGVTWCNGNELEPDQTLWDTYKEETCYWVDCMKLTFGSLSSSGNSSRYNHYIKCTFHAGCELPDFEIRGSAEDQLLI